MIFNEVIFRNQESIVERIKGTEKYKMSSEEIQNKN
jgi:hypothetical protein